MALTAANIPLIAELTSFANACLAESDPTCRLVLNVTRAGLDLALACASEAERQINYLISPKFNLGSSAACSTDEPLSQLVGCLAAGAAVTLEGLITSSVPDPLGCGAAAVEMVLALRGVVDALAECLGTSSPLPPGTVIGQSTLTAECIVAVQAATDALNLTLGCLVAAAQAVSPGTLAGPPDTLGCGPTTTATLQVTYGAIAVLAWCVGVNDPLDPGDTTGLQAANVPEACAQAVATIAYAAAALKGCTSAAAQALGVASDLFWDGDPLSCGPLARTTWDITRGAVGVLARCVGVSDPLAPGDESAFSGVNVQSLCDQAIAEVQDAVTFAVQCATGVVLAVLPGIMANLPANVDCGATATYVLDVTRGGVAVLAACVGVQDPLGGDDTAVFTTNIPELCRQAIDAASDAIDTAQGCAAAVANAVSPTLPPLAGTDSLGCGPTATGALDTARGGVEVLAACLGVDDPLEPGNTTGLTATNIPELCAETVQAVREAATVVAGCLVGIVNAIVPGLMLNSRTTLDCEGTTESVLSTTRGGVNVLARCLGLGDQVSPGNETGYQAANIPQTCADAVEAVRDAVTLAAACVVGVVNAVVPNIAEKSAAVSVDCGATTAAVLSTTRGGVNVLARCLGLGNQVQPGDETGYYAANVPETCAAAVDAVAHVEEIVLGCVSGVAATAVPSAPPLAGADTLNCGGTVASLMPVVRSALDTVSACLGLGPDGTAFSGVPDTCRQATAAVADAVIGLEGCLTGAAHALAPGVPATPSTIIDCGSYVTSVAAVVSEYTALAQRCAQDALGTPVTSEPPPSCVSTPPDLVPSDVTSATLPGTPDSVVGTNIDATGSVVVYWAAPENGTVDSYVVIAHPGELDVPSQNDVTVEVPGTSTQATITGLATDGTGYSYSVLARAGGQAGEWSEASSPTSTNLRDPDVPTEPTTDRIWALDGQLDYEASVEVDDIDGGMLQVEFQLYDATGTALLGTTTSGAAIAGMAHQWTVPRTLLVNGLTYQWRARVKDGAHVGAWSSMTPFTVDRSGSAPDVSEYLTAPQVTPEDIEATPHDTVADVDPAYAAAMETLLEPAEPTPNNGPSKEDLKRVTVFVHGIHRDPNGGSSCVKDFEGDQKGKGAFGFLRSQGYAGVRHAAYYAKDSGCDDSGGTAISWYGLHTRYYNGADGSHASHITGAGGFTGHNSYADIRHLGYHFAWYVYDRYSSKGVSINVVAHSMGGLLLRWALYGVSEHAKGNSAYADFPPYLTIKNAITYGTPHRGAKAPGWTEHTPKYGCTVRECRQMANNSDFTKFLKDTAATVCPQGRNGTNWSMIGSYNDGVVSAESATGMWSSRCAHSYRWKKHNDSQPSTGHSEYMKDLGTQQDRYVYVRAGNGDYRTIDGFYRIVRTVGYAMESASW